MSKRKQAKADWENMGTKPSQVAPEIEDHLHDYDDGECFMCGGSGELDECECSAFEDICCCLNPVPRACPECIERERDATRRATLQTTVE